MLIHVSFPSLVPTAVVEPHHVMRVWRRMWHIYCLSEEFRVSTT